MVECTRLESEQTVKGLGSSNLPLSEAQLGAALSVEHSQRMNHSRPVLLSFFALAACGSGTASNPVVCPPTPQVIVAPPSLIAPQSGASGIAFNGVNVRITYNPANDGTLRLVDQSGATVQGPAFMTFQSTVFPPGTSTTDAEAVSPPLRPHTLYTVFVDAVYPPAGPCPVPGPAGPTSYQLGTFTTANADGTAAVR